MFNFWGALILAGLILVGIFAGTSLIATYILRKRNNQ